MLESDSMPEIANLVATTGLGTMALREMMDDSRSRMKAIAIANKGNWCSRNKRACDPGIIMSGLQPPNP
jgi:hypothetical protein